MSHYTAIHLVKHFEGTLGPDLFEVIETPVPDLEEGQFLVKQTHMSLDPAMLGWMSASTDSYIPPVPLNTVMRSSGVGDVVASKHPDFQVGDRVSGMFGWTEMAISTGERVNKLDPSLPAEMILSVFALPGLTAVQGLYGFADSKPGETLIVTGAAGSVGSIVGQLAKADGLTVIGVVGSDEKATWITEELGFDGAINYKTDDLAAKLDELAPNGVDFYFENTGGPIQQHVFNRMNAHGRIIVCGMIADYTAAEPSPGPNWINLIKKRIMIRGYAMPDHLHNAQDLIAKLTPYVQKGQVKYRAHVLDGLPSAIDGLKMFFTGENRGKLMVKL